MRLFFGAGLHPAVKAVCGQLAEIDADYHAVAAVLRLGGAPVMTSVLRGQRDRRETFRRAGDVCGDRFARERMLGPRHLLDHRGELPPPWRGPGRRTASLWPRMGLPYGLPPHHALVVSPTDPGLWRDLARHLRDTGAARSAALADHMAMLTASG
ncbi:hypothetical protein [Thermoactinospora rubra]|uniref:hypothetical protein n=1 Tax=Thermoactinospora rubra TaxID=1088767 RepID=UPI000A11A5DA|nr:hypothetical protein [Thermoactinospora rubra]